MRHTTLLIAIILSAWSLHPTLTWAASAATPSATPVVDKDLIRERLKERLEQTVKGVADDLTASRSASQSSFRGYFGTVSEATKKSLKLSTATEEFTVNFTEDTTLVSTLKGKGRRNLETDAIEDGWFAIAIGSLGTDGKTMDAVRINFADTVTEPPKREILLGKVQEVDDKTITIANGEVKTITIPKTFALTIQGVQKGELDDVTINDKVIAVVGVSTASPSPSPRPRARTSASPTPSPTPDTNKGITYELKQLYVIPGAPGSEEEETQPTTTESSPSASPKATTAN